MDRKTLRKEIPKSFDILGNKVHIKFSRVTRKLGTHGYCDFEKNTIVLSAELLDNQDLLMITYLHEIMHWIFYVLGEDDLNQNEKLIDLIAQLQHQIRKTSKS